MILRELRKSLLYICENLGRVVFLSSETSSLWLVPSIVLTVPCSLPHVSDPHILRYIPSMVRTDSLVSGLGILACSADVLTCSAGILACSAGVLTCSTGVLTYSPRVLTRLALSQF